MFRLLSEDPSRTSYVHAPLDQFHFPFHCRRERCLLLAQVTELRTALHSEKLEREGAEAEFAERAERAEREAAEAASEAAAGEAGLRRELERTKEVRIMMQCKPLYRDRLKGLYVVARNFFLLLLNFSCLALPGCCLTKSASLYSGPCSVSLFPV